MDYSQFKVVYEVNKAFYIIKNDGEGYMINKKYMHNGQIYLLREFFMKKFKLRYKKYNF